MDAILHVLGVCGDAHSHLDLIDVLFMGTTASPIIILIKLKVKSWVKKWKKQ